MNSICPICDSLENSYWYLEAYKKHICETCFIGMFSEHPYFNENITQEIIFDEINEG